MVYGNCLYRPSDMWQVLLNPKCVLLYQKVLRMYLFIILCIV